MAESSTLSMFAALLDRSIAEIGESAADGRFFDREKVVRVADVWDNNTFALFGAASRRPGWAREHRARAALRWMAELGPERRAWMIEQAAVAGFRLEPLLGPQIPEVRHYRDYQGHAQPGVVPLTAAVAASVMDDYDLARAEVRTVRVERAGQRLSGYLALAAPRRYDRPPDHSDAVVQLHFDDVRAVQFHSGDMLGATVTVGAAEVDVGIGAKGHLRATAAEVTFDDWSWHHSRRGRDADAENPSPDGARRKPRASAPPQPRGAASDAAMVIRAAMLEIRSLRYAKLVGRVPLREMCQALAAAGDQVLTAAAQKRSARDHAFRRLAEKWIVASPHLAHTITTWLPDNHGLSQMSPAGSRPPAPAAMPAQAQLTLAGYTAAHTSHGIPRDATAVINLAIPDDAGEWPLQALEFPRPTRVTLDTAAFSAPGAVSGIPGMSLALGAGALTVARLEPGPHHHDAEGS